MHCNFIPLLILKKSLLFGRPHKGIPHYDNTDILHPIDAELRDKDHVILVEWEFALEIVLKEVNCDLNRAETLFRLS